MSLARRLYITTLFAVIALFAATFPGSSGATMAGPGGCCPMSEEIVE
jgi:hypothetical protein